MNKYTAIFKFSSADGWWTVTCAELPAAISQGRTRDEARANLKEAIELVLETQREAAMKEAGDDAQLEELVIG